MKSPQLVLPGQHQNLNTLEQDFVELVLGRPSANCKHFGICQLRRVRPSSFKRLNQESQTSLNSLFALASLKEGAYFELAFLRSSINKAVFKKYFSSGIFRMEEPFTLHSNILRRPVRVPKGLYMVNFSDTLLTIRFDIEYLES